MPKEFFQYSSMTFLQATKIKINYLEYYPLLITRLVPSTSYPENYWYV